MMGGLSNGMVTIGLAISMLLVAGCDVRGDQKMVEKEQDKIIELRIVMPKTEIVEEEKFQFTVVIENKHHHPIVFYWRDDPFYDFVTITTTYPDGTKLVSNKFILSCVRSEWHSFTLKPGEKYVKTFTDIFSTPGTYTYEAEFQYLGIKARASPVKFVVKPKNP